MPEPIKVLMVEDVKTDAELALRELKRAGIPCIGRRVDTESALRSALYEMRPDIILSDFSMPHFDGMSALALAWELCPDVPFIFLSGTIGEEYAIRALKNGASDYVLKSNLVRLPPAVERAIADTKARTERKRIENLRTLEHAVTRGMAYADSGSVMLAAAIRTVCEMAEWDCGRYFAFDRAAGMLRMGDAWGLPDPLIERFIAVSRGTEFAPGTGLPGCIYQTGKPMWSVDAGNDARPGQQPVAPEPGMRSSFGIPVVSANEVIGVLCFSSQELRKPDEGLLQTMGVIGSQIGQFMQRMRIEDEQRRFRVAMDTSADMIVLIDASAMRFLDANATVCRELGYSREELLAMGPQDVLPATREELSASYAELIADPSSPSAGAMYSYYRCKDGSRLPFESTRRVVRSGDTYIVVAVSRDIRNRMAAEEALRKSNERFNLAVRATNDVIWDWDLVTGDIWWNENLTRAFGHERDEIGHNARAWYELIHADDRDRVVSALHRLLELGGESWSDDYRLRRRDGGYAFVIDRGQVIRDGDGKALRMIGAKADATALKEAEGRLSYLAQFDTLTGLPNRHLFRDRLGQTLVQARRNNWPVAVLFVDIDRFKRINDTFGQAAGDKLLKETARAPGRMRAAPAIPSAASAGTNSQ